MLLLGKDIEIDEHIYDKLDIFYELHRNAELNLTAITEKEDFYIKHYLDSVYYYFKFCNGLDGNLADIGSGGGFPGIVLAIFFPDVKVSLIESIGKKCKFLEKAISILNLQNVEVINSRAEDIKNRKYNNITARGVSSVLDIIRYSEGILADNYKMVLYKGERVDAELLAAKSVISKRGLDVKIYRVDKEFTRTYCVITPASVGSK